MVNKSKRGGKRIGSGAKKKPELEKKKQLTLYPKGLFLTVFEDYEEAKKFGEKCFEINYNNKIKNHG